MPSFPRCGTGAVTGPRASGRLRRTTKGVDMTTVPLSAGRSTAVPSTDVPSTVGHQSVRRRRLRRGMVGGLVATALVLVGSAASAADDVPAGRRIVDHTVRAGETATGLAVRYHAWTAELIRRNHLGSGGGLVVGQRLEIPVVVAALPHRRADRRVTHHAPRHATHHDRGAARRGAPAARPPAGSSPGTATVRHAVAGAAARLGVDPQLALAVSWQESGWQMDRRSDAGAVGAMQVLPASGAGWSCTPAATCTCAACTTTPPPGSRCCACWPRDQVHAARRRGVLPGPRRRPRARAVRRDPGVRRRRDGDPGAARGRPPARLSGLADAPRHAGEPAGLGAGPAPPYDGVPGDFPHRVAGGSLCCQNGTPARAGTRAPATR